MAEDDGWYPGDDDDYWDFGTGERAYQGNPDALRWRVVGPGFHRYDQIAGERLTTRSDAVTCAGLFVSPETLKKLVALNAVVAGWMKIVADGWIIEPIKPDA